MLNSILLIYNANWIPGWQVVLSSGVSQWRSKCGGEVESGQWPQGKVKPVWWPWPCVGSVVSPPSSFLCLYMAGARVPENCPDCPSLLIQVHLIVSLPLVFISWLNDNSGSPLSMSGQSPSVCLEAADLALSQSRLFRLEGHREKW